MNIFQIRNINNRQTINRNRWSLRFVGLSDIFSKVWGGQGVALVPGISKRYAAVANALGTTPKEAVDNLELSLFSVSELPSIGFDILDINRFNDTVRTPGKFKVMPEFTVDFIDYTEGSASAIMQLWQAFIGDKETGAMGFKKDFVLPEALFTVYGPDAPGYEVEATEDIPWLQRYKIKNLWPAEIKLGPHGDTSEIRKVSVTFIIDNIYPIGIRGYKSIDGNMTKPEDRYTNVPQYNEQPIV